MGILKDVTNWVKEEPAKAFVGTNSGMGGWAALGGLGESGLNWWSQQETNQANAHQAHLQRKFQQEMSNTAHQREVKDLIAAGLNPILSAGGGGASSPAGASGTMVAPQVDLPDMLSYGVSLKQLEQQDQRIQIDKANSAAMISKVLSETELNKMRRILAQKGMIRADLEGEASGILQKFIRAITNGARKNEQPTEVDHMPLMP